MTLRTKRLPRRAAALIPVALTAALLLPGGASHADNGTGFADPAAAAATWATTQLTDGTHASGDHGLTADIVLGLASTGTAGEVSERATDWLAEQAAAYITRGDEGTVFAGGVAKLALVASVQHRDPADFGGEDLTATLLGTLQETGRFSDAGPAGDMSNQFTQTLAVLALDRTGDVPDSAVAFLSSTRCADGGYPLSLRRNPDRCTSDTDSTGMAVQALLAVGRTADAEPGLDWLEGQQQDNGGFGYNARSAPNSNSTALAVQALAAGGRQQAAAEGVDWLLTMQAGCDAPAADRGAVGYMEPVADGMALRATAQAIPALAGVALGDVDGADAAPGTVATDCSPGGPGGPGGSDEGGQDNGGQDNGGQQGGGDQGGGDQGGGDQGGDTGAGGAQAGAEGTSDGSGGSDEGGSDEGGALSGGTADGTSTHGSGGTTSGGTTTSGAASGTDGPGTATGGAAAQGGTASGGLSPDGSLAGTGASGTQPLVWAAIALMFSGAAAYLIARKRRAAA
ncbi:prenyltransferase/squalene oxidase repeat-containing protein [Streptomyces marincola]|uniref:prenyltransferase/squalene oxidase repeat-containing protein n=1 Tax=Streptomyces marincola TaxID=2878388 RepID=UPI001CF3576A|nr:prenyltransferase/squalene oxidase repeat-containing protein [Streptomyces marincola]UCM86972.1 hypothetical protein LC193_02915 [Streptomyces marincola]